LLADLPQLASVGADGIGLYRTEVPFMVRSDFPDAAEQTRTYRAVLERAGERPVVFRTLDIGGDKILPYFRGLPAENPALGWRAIRIGLDRPALLRAQIRALIQAAGERPLSLMFPLVTEVAEFEAARRLVDGELQRAERLGLPLPARLEVGLMLEVPALLWQLPALVRRVDFVSVGSNDLLQYLFACDRSSPSLSQRYDPLSPAVLKILKQVVETCGDAGVPVSLCGELAAEPLAAMALVGLGFPRLSMTAEAVGEVRATVRAMRFDEVRDYVTGLVDLPHHSVRDRLRAFAVDHDIPV
jgi:phosphotransferase system enzyme I (PtsP)